MVLRLQQPQCYCRLVLRPQKRLRKLLRQYLQLLLHLQVHQPLK
jgi:hypothetical protein